MAAPTFQQQLEDLLNRHSQENVSNTPDFILAKFLVDCMAAFNAAVKERTKWRGETGAKAGHE